MPRPRKDGPYRPMPPSSSDQTALQLLDGLYAGVASPEKWQAALQQVNTALGGASAALVSLHRPTNQLTIDYAGALIPDLEAGFIAMQEVDPARAAVPLLAAGKIYVDHDFHGASSLQRMPFYRDFLAPLGIGHYALLPVAGDTEYLPVMSIQREAGRRTFTPRELQLMQAVQPHLRNALSLRQQLRHQRAESLILKSTLDSLSFPLLACSPQGRVVTGNTAGQRWLRTPGCPLSDNAIPVPATLRRLLEQACGRDTAEPTSGSLMLADDDILVTLPLCAHGGVHWHDALALVAIQGPRWRKPPPGTLLRAMFGLTPAEIRLVHHLMRHDEPLPAVAEQLRLSLNTVRTQLRAIFQKTHTRRQSDLIRLVGQLALLRSDACP